MLTASNGPTTFILSLAASIAALALDAPEAVQRLFKLELNPRFPLAFSVLVAPVPPLLIATTPVTLLAVPVVLWFNVGISLVVIVLNDGTPDELTGEAKNDLCV